MSYSSGGCFQHMAHIGLINKKLSTHFVREYNSIPTNPKYRLYTYFIYFNRNSFIKLNADIYIDIPLQPEEYDCGLCHIEYGYFNSRKERVQAARSCESNKIVEVRMRSMLTAPLVVLHSSSHVVRVISPPLSMTHTLKFIMFSARRYMLIIV